MAKNQTSDEFSFTTTKWKNELDVVQVIHLFIPTGNGISNLKKKITFQPGEEKELPSEYDNAIHTLDKSGMIMGGLAPLLTKVGVSEPIHPSLDYVAVNDALEMEKLIAETIKKDAYLKAVVLKAEQDASLDSLKDKIVPVKKKPFGRL
jgi:hypothetical protein